MHIDESLWVALGFFLFILLVWKKAKSSFETLLDERTKNITSQLQEAQKLREEAEAELGKIQSLKSETEKEVQTIILNAKASAERIKNNANEKIQETMKRREKQAIEKINASRDSLIFEIREKIANLTTRVSKEIILNKLDKKKSKELVDNSIKKISSL